MRRLIFFIISPLALLLLFCTGTGCKKKRAPRKKLPQLESVSSWEGIYSYGEDVVGINTLPINATDTIVNGQNFLPFIYPIRQLTLRCLSWQKVLKPLLIVY